MSEETTFAALFDLSQHQKQRYGRQIHVELYDIDGGVVAITRFHDDYHDLSMAMRVDDETGTIRSARGRMERHPFSTCPHAVSSLNNLDGLVLMKRGVLSEIHQRMPRHQGCTHMTEMVETTLRTLFGYLSHDKGDPDFLSLHHTDRRHLLTAHPRVKETCYSFSEMSREPGGLEQAQKNLANRKKRPSSK